MSNLDKQWADQRNAEQKKLVNFYEAEENEIIGLEMKHKLGFTISLMISLTMFIIGLFLLFFIVPYISADLQVFGKIQGGTWNLIYVELFFMVSAILALIVYLLTIVKDLPEKRKDMAIVLEKRKMLEKKKKDDLAINNSETGFIDQLAILFYNECKNAKINKFESAIEHRRAKQLIKNNPNFQINNIDTKYLAMFERGKKLTLESNKLEKLEKEKSTKKERITKELLNERLFYSRQFEICKLSGHDKTSALLEKEKIQEIIKETAPIRRNNSMANLGTVMVSSTHREKTADWAIIGGAMSTLAGPAAGVMAAYDTMQNNAKIEAENKKNLQRSIELASQLPYESTKYSTEKEAEEKISEKYQKIIEESSLKVIDDSFDLQVLLDMLDCVVENAIKSETGALLYNLKVIPRQKIFIDGEIKASIDGSVIVQFLKNNIVVFESYVPFPKYGIYKKTNIKGICIDDSSEEYFEMPEYDDIRIASNKLWLLER